jgi:putative Holliday junction resolvase
MQILGVDYGLKKLGFALGDSQTRLAEPLTVFRSDNEDQAIKKVIDLLKLTGASMVVVGLSEGKVARSARLFGEKISKRAGVRVDYFDETLTTYEAKSLALKSGIKRKKRTNMEDAFAAAIILQNYLESLGNDI